MVQRSLIVCGLSHHGAPLEVREKLAAAPERLADELRALCEASSLSEGVLLSTCNRVELIGMSSEPHRARERVVAQFNKKVAPLAVDPFVYEHQGVDAVRHLFRVACGLDSMVLGEPQILGQVKTAYATASQHGSVGPLLGRCFERAFSVAKRVRTETKIASGNVSVSSIACELAERIFGELSGRRVLLIGAGKMSETAARSLTARGASLTVINRSPERAQSLAAACGGEYKPMEALAPELSAADVVISSTAKDGFIISYELMLGVVKMRKWRQLFIIDIAVPRDVDPRVESLRNVFLYDMDDLKRVSHTNMTERERAATAAHAIIDDEVKNYERWLRTLELTPTLVALRERVRETVLREKQKAQAVLAGLTPAQEKALDAMCESIVNQLLHAPLTELKRGSESEDGSTLVAAVQRLFKLELKTPGAPGIGQPDPEPNPQSSELAPADGSGRRR